LPTKICNRIAEKAQKIGILLARFCISLFCIYGAFCAFCSHSGAEESSKLTFPMCRGTPRGRTIGLDSFNQLMLLKESAMNLGYYGRRLPLSPATLLAGCSNKN
jgi:hypothetical protein